MRLLVWLAVFAVVVASSPAWSDGEPSARPSDTGILVPVDQTYVSVLDQRITITLPSPNGRGREPAVIRVEYTLARSPDESREDKSRPLDLQVAWPSGGLDFDWGADGLPVLAPACRPAIKLDGRPVGYRFLSFDGLADEYVKGWLARIDALLRLKPALWEQVLKAREPVKEGEIPGEAAGRLGMWIREHGLVAQGDHDPSYLAGGLLGMVPSGYWGRRDQCVQAALQWLDPSHEEVDVHAILSRRWSQDTRLLDPGTGQLYDARDDGISWTEPEFGVFRFPITLQAGRKHRLVVQYGHLLGGGDFFDAGGWSGLVYLMEPAQRWGDWRRTTIEVRVPTGWPTVAIRPPAKRVAIQGGMAVYRIEMGQPCENLYVSVSER